ncbi:MAG: glucose-methanol-choline oxidoreductase [Fluviicola sp.]|nr:MAG: glucose-methanol-choline oxidoreductase [Fluviicola sp.]
MKKQVDVLIIGSGVAAASLSQRLLEKDPNRSILVLEAGIKVPMKDYKLYQDYLVTGKYPYEFCEDLNYPNLFSPGENVSESGNQLQLSGGRAMMFGGSTAHWGGWSFRLKPEDFQLYTNTQIDGTIDWPINYNDLEPYYGQAEDYIGVSGDSTDQVPPRTTDYPFCEFPYTLEDQGTIEAFEKRGLSYAHMPIARHGVSDTDSPHAPCKTTGTCKYCPFGARYVAGNFLDEMLRYGSFPNFEILQGAIVDRITMSSRSVATGAIYHDKFTTDSHTVEAETVIVAAGSIEAAKLMQRSVTPEWPDGVGNQTNNNLVGKNLVSHPFVYWEATLPENPQRLQPEMDFPTFISRHFDNKEQQPFGKFLTVRLNSFSDQFDMTTNNQVSTLTKAMQTGLNREEVDAVTKGPVKVQLITQIEVFTKASNYVSNTKPNVINHLGMQETNVKYVTDPGFDAHVNNIQTLLNPIFNEMGATDFYKASDSIRADHAACVTRMSDSPKTGVVDKDLKVFDTDNLYVLSNGSFSSLGAVNPTITLTALSLRLGDHLNAK